MGVLSPEVGEVGFRDRVDLDDHSVVRVSLEESGHGLKPLGKCSRSDLRGGAEAEEETGIYQVSTTDSLWVTIACRTEEKPVFSSYPIGRGDVRFVPADTVEVGC